MSGFRSAAKFRFWRLSIEFLYLSWRSRLGGVPAACGGARSRADPAHPVLVDPSSPTGVLRYLPAHPHEGAVIVPDGAAARVIATGRSQATGREFNLAVAFERGEGQGLAILQSTFHHFLDYNWDLATGCPSFVSERPGDGMAREPQALADTRRYALNVAAWLGGR
jgi:hypothetical protein